MDDATLYTLISAAPLFIAWAVWYFISEWLDY